MYLLGIVELKDDSIDFTGKGISKAVSTSAKENKLLLIKYLPQLIENANEVASQPNVKDKREAKQYTYLMTHAIVGGKRENVIVTIFTDANGNKYYNHILNDEENKKGSLYIRRKPLIKATAFRPCGNLFLPQLYLKRQKKGISQTSYAIN